MPSYITGHVVIQIFRNVYQGLYPSPDMLVLPLYFMVEKT
jgi:hypothetical protein